MKLHDVTDYGAKGNGVTNDTVAVQRAIDACPRGGTLFFPRGCFPVIGLRVAKPINIMGAGAGRRAFSEYTGSISDFASSEILAIGQGWVFSFTKPEPVDSLLQNDNLQSNEEAFMLPVKIENLTLRGNRRTPDAGGLFFSNVDWIGVDKVNILEFRRSAIYLDRGCRECSFSRIHTRYNGDGLATNNNGGPWPDISVVDNETASPDRDKNNFISFTDVQSIFPVGDCLHVSTLQMSSNGRTTNRISFFNCVFHGYIPTATVYNEVQGSATLQQFTMVQLRACERVSFHGCRFNHGGLAKPKMHLKTETAGTATAVPKTPRLIQVIGCDFSAIYGSGSPTGTSAIKADIGSGVFIGNIYTDSEQGLIIDHTNFSTNYGESGPQILMANASSQALKLLRYDFAAPGNPTQTYGFIPSGSSLNLEALAWCVVNTTANNNDKQSRVGMVPYVSTQLPFITSGGRATATANECHNGGGPLTFVGAATDHHFWVAPTVNVNASSAVEAMQIDNAANVTLPGAGFLGFVERTDPAAPATNAARIYVRDNGSGKTQLFVRFATGAIQVLATEP